MALGPVQDVGQFRPVIHFFEGQQFHRRAGDDEAVELLAAHLGEGFVVGDQVFGGDVLRLVRGGVQQGHFHLQRGVAEQAQQLGLGGDLGGHQVEDGHAQRADILVPGAFLAHDEDIFAFEGQPGGQGFGDSDGHGTSKCRSECRMMNVRNLHSSFMLLIHAFRQRLVQVPQDVFDIFDADAQADEIGRHAGGDLFLLAQLAVGGGGGMDGQALGIAHVGQVAEQLQALDEASCRLPAPPLMPKPRIAPGPFGQVFLGQLDNRGGSSGRGI